MTRDFPPIGVQAHTMAVLAGLFRLKNLVDAQDVKHFAVVWERDLAPLVEFVRAAR